MRNAALGGTLEIPCSQVLFHTYLFVPSASFLMKGRSVNSGQSTEQAPVARHVTLSQPFWLEKSTVTQAQWVEVMGTNPSYTKGANLPVVNVSWTDAQAYVAKLNEKHLLPEGWKFAMPTEAQWEYANRGPYSGTIQPAAWGVQDMRGNIYEWCADWYEDSLKGGIDPSGPTSGECRVYRGAKRGCSYPDDRRSDLGFRTAIVRDQ
jgi:formylglycine-generating enzyme required for sulfatase activity